MISLGLDVGAAPAVVLVGVGRGEVSYLSPRGPCMDRRMESLSINSFFMSSSILSSCSGREGEKFNSKV